MAEYKYKNMVNENGWGMTFNATGRFPIIGSRIFPTLSDLNEFISNPNGTAIAGIQVAVISDGDNNGTYQIDFIDTTIIDTTITDETIGNIKCYDDVNDKTNLKAVKLVTVDNQGGIESGNVANGFYGTVADKEVFVTRSGSEGSYEYKYVDESGQSQTYTPSGDELNRIRPYIVLNMTNGDKVYIDANEFKAVSDTFVESGVYDNVTKKLTLTRNDNSTFDIDLSKIVIDNSTVTTNESYTTLEATTGAFNDDAVQVIKNYIDNYDCGTFNINLEEDTL